MAKPPSKNYKQLSEQLAKILDWFEGDQVELDQAIAKYQEASKIIAEMESYLKTAQNKVRKITGSQQV